MCRAVNTIFIYANCHHCFRCLTHTEPCGQEVLCADMEETDRYLDWKHGFCKFCLLGLDLALEPSHVKAGEVDLERLGFHHDTVADAMHFYPGLNIEGWYNRHQDLAAIDSNSKTLEEFIEMEEDNEGDVEAERPGGGAMASPQADVDAGNDAMPAVVSPPNNDFPELEDMQSDDLFSLLNTDGVAFDNPL
ncbi:MAG: hypothetical protein STHCBS139747_007756 [Sporothrix thermara]